MGTENDGSVASGWVRGGSRMGSGNAVKRRNRAMARRPHQFDRIYSHVKTADLYF